MLKQHGIIGNMSRNGKCSDNAPVQRFFSSLKREWTGEQVIADVPQYVAMYYNSKRPHPTIG